MKKLKIGDKVYSKKYQRFGKDIASYNITEVERLTTTTAVLKNGVKLINSEYVDWNGNYCYQQYGEKSTKYYVLTKEIIKEFNLWIKLVKAKRFVDSQKWTDEQYLKIYEILALNNNF